MNLECIRTIVSGRVAGAHADATRCAERSDRLSPPLCVRSRPLLGEAPARRKMAPTFFQECQSVSVRVHGRQRRLVLFFRAAGKMMGRYVVRWHESLGWSPPAENIVLSTSLRPLSKTPNWWPLLPTLRLDLHVANLGSGETQLLSFRAKPARRLTPWIAPGLSPLCRFQTTCEQSARPPPCRNREMTKRLGCELAQILDMAARNAR